MLTQNDFLRLISASIPSAIQKINGVDTVVIRNETIEEIVISEDLVCPIEVLIENCEFEDKFEIQSGVYMDRFIIRKCKIKYFIAIGGKFEWLFINECEIFRGITLTRREGYHFEKTNVSIENNKTDYIHVSNLSFEYIAFSNNDAKGIHYSNSLFYPEDLPNRKYEKLYNNVKYLNFTIKEGSSLDLEYVAAEQVSFHGTLANAKISLNQVKVHKMAFEDFTKSSNGILNLSRITALDENSIFIIRNSYLGTTSFYDCNFNSFKQFQVANSHFLDIVYSYMKWPKTIGVAGADRMGPSEYSKSEALIQLRETYRQLKIAASKQGDKLQEAVFYRNELFFLNKTLDKSTHLSTKIVLFLSLISNNHKQNWILPVIWLLFINLIFVLLLSSISIRHLHFNQLVFFHFLNPTHRFSDLKITDSSVNLTFDLFSRIITSFLIYQTITAFRKLS